MPRKAAPPPEQVLNQALTGTGLVEVLKASSTSDSAKLLFRVSDKRAWLAVLEKLLLAASQWSVHVCQQYFIHNGRMVYGWNFILRPEEGVKLKEAAQNAASAIQAAMTKAESKRLDTEDDDSFPLIGASPRRTAKLVFDPRAPGPRQGGPSHKGAFNVVGD